MISLTPPYQVIGGYTLLADHADPTLFYAVPPAPRLAQTQTGGPAISLVQYLGGGTGSAKLEGGLLTITTELPLPDDVLPLLRQRLASSLPASARDDLRIMPVLFDEGTVELVALGAASATEARPAPFTIKFLGSGRPSLGGANVATFQLVLDASAAELVERSLDAPELPIIAIYRVAFAGLRPNFQIKIEADWQKFYHSLKNKAGLNVWYVAADAEKQVTETLEESGITIDTMLFGTGDSAQAAAERARRHLVDWVMQRLFTPMVDPAVATAAGIGSVIEDTVSSLVRSIRPGLSYQLRQLDDTQVRLLSARMDESVAERREVVPQGTLGAFLHRFKVDEEGRERPAWRAMRESLVQKVNLSGFPRLEVKVGVEDRFTSDGLREVRIELGRPQEGDALRDSRTLVFRTASEREDYVVNLLGESQASFRAPYRYRIEAHFDPAGAFGPHEPATSGWQSGNTTELFAEPRWAYVIREVEVGLAPTFSFNQFPAVTVELQYAAEGQAARQTARIRFVQEKPQATWRFRSFSQTPLPYEYQVTYHRPQAAGGDIETPFREQIDDWLSLPDPLPVKRALNIFVNLPWPELAMSFLQIRYTDDTNGVRFEEQIDLNAATRFIRRDYPIASNGPRTLSYRLTLLLTSGGLLEGSWRETEDDRLVLDRRLVDRRVVTVRAIGGTFADNKLNEVRVGMQVREPSSNQVRAETEVRLMPPFMQPSAWEYLLGDPPARTVHVNALFVDTNGFIHRTQWQATESDLVVVDIRNRAIRV